MNEQPDDETLNMYVEALRDAAVPFDNYVSRANRRDIIDIKSSHSIVEREVFRALKRTLRDALPRFVPIIGSAGSGKTHFYWFLRDRQQIEKDEWECVYIPSPPAPIRIPLHIYTSIMDEIGRNLLEEVANDLAEKYMKREGILRRKQYLAEMVVREYPGLASDVVRVLVAYATEKNLKPLAERWLLAENLTEEDLKELGVSRIIEEDDTVVITLKTLFKNYSKIVLLYFDELEIPYRTRGAEAEGRFLEYLKRIYNEIPGVLIVSACLMEMWDRVLETADSATKTRMEAPSHLQPFSLMDLEEFYIQSMKVWWETEHNIEPPEFDSFFPLSKEILSQIISKTNGNPRESIKYLRTYIDNFLAVYKEMGDYQEKSDSILPKTSIPTLEESVKEAAVSVEEIMTIDPNPASVMNGVLDFITLVALGHKIPLNVELEYTYEIERSQKIAARITLEGERIGIDVPSVKSFDRSGGVAAYYSLKRLIDAKKAAQVIDRGILIVPTDTKGQKFSLMREEARDFISVIEFNGKSAENIIKGGLMKEIVVEAKEVIEEVFSTFKIKFVVEE